MRKRKGAEVDIDLVREELGIPVEFKRPLQREIQMLAIGWLIAWALIFGVVGEDACKAALTSLGIL